MNQTAKILVVDDDPDVLAGLSFFLRSAGYTTVEAATGGAGLALAKTEKPDLVLLDVELPDASGLEICQRIKSDPESAHVFVVHISGAYTSSQDQVQGLGAGADGYIVKSIHPQELLARVEAFLRIALTERQLWQAQAGLERRVAERTEALEKINASLLTEISERQRAEGALRTSQARLQFMLTATPAVIYSCVPAGPFACTFISDNIRQLLGYEPHEFTANPAFWEDGIHPEDKARVLNELPKLLKRGWHVDEYRFRHKEGHYRWMRDELRLVCDASGKPVEVAGCWVDISERKGIEVALQAKTDQLQAITHAMTAFLHHGDWPAAGAMLLRNAVEQTSSEQGFLGLVDGSLKLRVLSHVQTVPQAGPGSAPDSSGPSGGAPSTPLENAKVDTLFGDVVATGRPVIFNEAADSPERGRPKPKPPFQSCLGVPIFKESGVVGMIAVANRPGGFTREDQNKIEILTQAAAVLYDSHRRQQRTAILEVERRAAVEQVMESRRQYQELVESLDGIIWEADARTFQFTFVNQQCERLLGYSVEHWMANMTWEKLIHPDDLARVVGVCQQAVKEKRNHSLEYRVLAADGRVVWVRDIATVVVRNGEPVRVIGVLLDATERKAADEKLLAYQKQLRSLASEMELAEERERRRIAVDLHDHIGQNLALAKIKLDELHDRASASEWASALRELQNLIQQTILDARSLLFEISPPVLHELGLGAALECLAEQFQAQHGIQIQFEEDSEPKPLHHDARAFLFKAVRELLLNVIKHARARHAKVSLQRKDNRLCAVVTDDGSGFNVADLQHHSGKISGFGLFNLRERLDYNGGELMIDSSPGHGARISLIFPLEQTGGPSRAKYDEH